MCGRFTLTDPDPRILRMRFGLDESVEIDEKPRYNIAPTDPVLAIRARDGKREPGRLRWGLVPYFADPDKFGSLLINARVETVEKVPAFRDAFREKRCLIPADGFYEWKETETGKQPFWVSRPGQEPFAFAGLWAKSKREDGSALHSCTILTCEPSEQIRPIHDRMPVLLTRDDEAGWLDPEAKPDDLRPMLRPDEELELKEVTDAVNDVREDGPQLLKPPLKLF
jgi:putative SOS response-associated peptidase YedK